MTRPRKTLVDFEKAEGAPKIKALERRLAEERAKVEALADVQGKIRVEHSADCAIRFGLISDTQIGSLYIHTAALRGFYEHAKKADVETVYHCGDVLDGHSMYRGHAFEVRDLGLEAQLDRLVEVMPREPRTVFITGNHDASFKNLAGVPVGKLIQQVRPDMTFVGEEQGHIEFETPKGAFKLMLIHPGGGTAYAISYRVQKLIEQLAGGSKPDMLAVGHFHKADFLPDYRNIAALQAGTFQVQTPFMARHGLAAHIGGWLVDVIKGENHNRIRAEFVAFYV